MAGGLTAKLPALLFILVWRFDGLSAQEEISVSQGKLRGTTLTSRNGRNFTAFLGIPYAQPPIGPLRFKNPLPAEPWNGTLLADKDGNWCPQRDENEIVVGDEDCLYLNVYTPQVNTSVLYPTMVYIHGGAFVKGDGTSLNVGPTYIMDKDVVLVSMNYRLGVLGFLSTGDEHATGNFGLKDQRLALHWVQNNIAAFGGDPDKVTIFGESAGGVSVNLHALSSSSKGLFHQYIAQSGSSLCFWAFQPISTYKDYATKLGNHTNCYTNNSQLLIDCLREVDAHSLVGAPIFEGLIKAVNTWTPTNEPELEGAFLTEKPLDLLVHNEIQDLPSIHGVVADEGLLISAQLYTNSDIYEKIANDTYNFLLYLTKTFISVEEAEALTSSVLRFYFNEIDPSDKRTFIKAVTDLISDTSFFFPTIMQLQIRMQKGQSPLYHYSFDYRGTFSKTIEVIGTTENAGVTHTDELIYLFPLFPGRSAFPNLTLSETDERVIDLMVDLWTSFAQTGTPTTNHTDDPNIWKNYDKDTTFLKIGHDSEPMLLLLQHFQESRMHFWMMQLIHAFVDLAFGK